MMHHLNNRNIVILKSGYVKQIYRKITDNYIRTFFFNQFFEPKTARKQFPSYFPIYVFYPRRRLGVKINQLNMVIQLIALGQNAKLAVSIAGNDHVMTSLGQQIGIKNQPVGV